MRLLPDHGAAVFVMANRTYAPAGAMARRAAELLAGTGALEPRLLPPSPALLAARDGVMALLERWDDSAAQTLAADNFFLDRPAAEWRDEMKGLRERHGHCRAGAFEPENWLRGRFRADCERGWMDVELTLAPTVPPRVQFLRLVPGMPPSERMTAAASSLAALAGGWNAEALAGLAAAANLDRSRLQSELHAVGDHYGVCRTGPALDGDGARSSRFRFLCDRGALDVSLTLDEAGRLSAATFTPTPGATCVP
jgi:hypothetical protein